MRLTHPLPVMLGPSTLFDDKNHVFVVQAVRGAYMSEVTFVDMRPHLDAKKTPADIDESSDAWDTRIDRTLISHAN